MPTIELPALGYVVVRLLGHSPQGLRWQGGRSEYISGEVSANFVSVYNHTTGTHLSGSRQKGVWRLLNYPSLAPVTMVMGQDGAAGQVDREPFQVSVTEGAVTILFRGQFYQFTSL